MKRQTYRSRQKASTTSTKRHKRTRHTMQSLHSTKILQALNQSQLFNKSKIKHSLIKLIQQSTTIKMRGGMNTIDDANKYLFNIPDNASSLSNTNSFFIANNNTEYTIRPPWEPRSFMMGVDRKGNILEIESEHAKLFNGYVFVINEEFIPNVDSLGKEIGSLTISIGSSHEQQCIVAELSSDNNYKTAKMITLSYNSKCSEYGDLPGEGQGSKIMMAIMQRILSDKNIVEACLYDNAMNSCKDGSKFHVSALYFLSLGELYYHRYGFYPHQVLESYIRAIVGMKKLSWNEFRGSDIPIDTLNQLEAIALSCNPSLSYTDKAMSWFSAVWKKNCSYMLDSRFAVFTSLETLFGVEKGSITDFWIRYDLYMNPAIYARVINILSSQYPKEDSRLFFEQVGENKECI